MTRASKTSAFIALVVIALALATATRSSTEEKRKCCFTNPAYTGVCEVEPSKDETCASILAYLNQAGSVGKSYCFNTDVRGGWAEVACKAK